MPPPKSIKTLLSGAQQRIQLSREKPFQGCQGDTEATRIGGACLRLLGYTSNAQRAPHLTAAEQLGKASGKIGIFFFFFTINPIKPFLLTSMKIISETNFRKLSLLEAISEIN